MFRKKARSLLKKVLIEGLISCETTFAYDVTIKLYQNHAIERVMRTLDAVDAVNVVMYFVIVTLLFQL